MPSGNTLEKNEVYPGETAGLTLLLVEDDMLSREMVLLRLQGLFSKIHVAMDGAEGLQLFKKYSPDIVLSDQVMPVVSGLEMLNGIRALDQAIPLIMMTQSMDNGTLLEAINLGVNRFIPKPFDYDMLVRVLHDIIRELLDKRQLEQCRMQEIELLRYRDSYNSLQQEAARRKERHVARHDLRNQVITGAEGVRWGINVVNSPRDIMCGDGYTIRNLADGRQLVFVVDAMGSGLSASLSALLATSFCNYQIERMQQGDFSLELFLRVFQEYLEGILLEEEVISCGFLLVDLLLEQIEMAMFGLPPLLLRRLDGSVSRISGNNPPLCMYNHDAVTTRISVQDIADLLIMTDGITDATLPGGGLYRERLEEDFHASPTLAALRRLFRFHTESGDLDDLTLLHLQRLDLPAAWSWKRELTVRQDGLAGTVHDFLEVLSGEILLGHGERNELKTLLDEALNNALEHGCLGIEHEEKTRLLQAGEYAAYLARQVAPGKARISLSATLWRGAGRPLLIMSIDDNGPGLPLEKYRDVPDGGGLKRIWRRCDSCFVGSPGCRLLLMKSIEGGRDYAT